MAFFKKVKKITGLWYLQVVTVGKPVTIDYVADCLALISTVSRGDTFAVLRVSVSGFILFLSVKKKC